MDGCTLTLYSLSVSTVTLLIKGVVSAPQATSLLDLPLELRDCVIEYSSTLCLTLAWFVAASFTGALEESWLELNSDDHRNEPLGIACLLQSWTLAVPLFAVAKTLGIAGVMLPLGAAPMDVLTLPTSWPGLASNVVGMLLATMLCRRLLLHRRGLDV